MKKFKEIFHFIVLRSREHKKAFAILALITLVMEAIALVSPYISGLAVDSFIEGFNFNYIAILVVIGFLLSIFSLYLQTNREKIDISTFNYDFIRNIHVESISTMLQMSVGQHSSKNSGVKDKIINKGTFAIRAMLQILVYDILPIVLKTVVTLVLITLIDLQIGLIALVGFLTIAIIQTRLSLKYLPKLQEAEKLGQETHTSFWQVFRNVSLFKSFGRENFGQNFIQQKIDIEHDFSKPLWVKFISRLIAYGSLIPLFVAMVMLVAAWKIGQGSMTIGQFVIVTAWSGMFFSQVGRIQWVQRTIARNAPAIREYKEFIEIKTDLPEPTNSKILKAVEGKIDINNISFFYSDSKEKKDVLNNISFSVKAGEFVGVVGKSGSGKSTLAKILMRLYDPQRGDVFIDGFNVKDLDRESFLDKIGYVGQEAYLFDWSIRDNIIFGLENVSDEEVEDAMQKSGLDEFLQELKEDRQGLDTMIGENGIKLSGGQKQRLTIARALLKKPAILILDEATASLDTETEREIQFQIDKLTRETQATTKIVIAHRLSTVAHADKILVFDSGNLIDQGTHEELLERCERYQDLVKHQDLQTV